MKDTRSSDNIRSSPSIPVRFILFSPAALHGAIQLAAEPLQILQRPQPVVDSPAEVFTEKRPIDVTLVRFDKRIRRGLRNQRQAQREPGSTEESLERGYCRTRAAALQSSYRRLRSARALGQVRLGEPSAQSGFPDKCSGSYIMHDINII